LWKVPISRRNQYLSFSEDGRAVRNEKLRSYLDWVPELTTTYHLKLTGEARQKRDVPV
jgi:hypothetical protein